MNDAFSVILTVYDQARELEELLPELLKQSYEAGYEVIVVDESSTDDTSDVLKLLKNQYPHLYSTFLPAFLPSFLPKPGSRILRRKQAFNIGLKAAKNEWVIITKIPNHPLADDVLQAISENIDDNPLTLGYHLKKGIRLQPFDSVDDARKHILRIERKLHTIREFKCGNYIWGRYDFIIVKKEYAYELLSLFEQDVPAISLFGIRLAIFCKNLWRRPSTTLLVTSP